MKTEFISKGQFCRARQIVVNFAGPFNPIPDISMAAPMINHHKTTKKTDFHANIFLLESHAYSLPSFILESPDIFFVIDDSAFPAAPIAVWTTLPSSRRQELAGTVAIEASVQVLPTLVPPKKQPGHEVHGATKLWQA